MAEDWKDIEGFSGLYKISNKGRLMSKLSGSWKIMSVTNSKGDYLSVVLRSGDKRKSKKIHQLVYESFIGPCDSCSHIHHINGDKQDNRVENLLALSPKEHSLEHLRRNPKIVEGIVFYNKYVKTKKVIQKDLEGAFIAVYDNCKAASDATGVCLRNIHQVASKTPYNKKGFTRKQAGGFIWEFAI